MRSHFQLADSITFAFAGTGSGTNLSFGPTGPIFTPDNGTFSGTLSVDTTTYQATAANVTFTFASGTYIYNVPLIGHRADGSPSDPGYISTVSGGSTVVSLYGGSSSLQFTFADPSSGLFVGSAISNAKLTLAAPSFNGPYALTGTVSPLPSTVAATPEPSSLILLGTGILGLGGAARRRFLKA